MFGENEKSSLECWKIKKPDIIVRFNIFLIITNHCSMKKFHGSRNNPNESKILLMVAEQKIRNSSD